VVELAEELVAAALDAQQCGQLPDGDEQAQAEQEAREHRL
jgi:hypothetical protein